MIYECPQCGCAHSGGRFEKDLSLCLGCIKDGKENHKAIVDDERRMRERAENDFILSMKRH